MHKWKCITDYRISLIYVYEIKLADLPYDKPYSDIDCAGGHADIIHLVYSSLKPILLSNKIYS